MKSADKLQLEAVDWRRLVNICQSTIEWMPVGNNG